MNSLYTCPLFVYTNWYQRSEIVVVGEGCLVNGEDFGRCLARVLPSLSWCVVPASPHGGGTVDQQWPGIFRTGSLSTSGVVVVSVGWSGSTSQR